VVGGAWELAGNDAAAAMQRVILAQSDARG